MGLTFDLANTFAVVSEVVVGGMSHTAGVKVGDHLVRMPSAFFFFLFCFGVAKGLRNRPKISTRP